MGVSDIFGYAFDTIKNNPKIILPYLLLIIFAGGIVLYSVLGGLENIYGPSLFTTPAGPQAPFGMAQLTQFFVGVLPVLSLVFLIAIFITPLIFGIYLSLADQSYRKKSINLGAAFHSAVRRYVDLLATYVLIAIIWIIAILIIAAIFLLPLVSFGAGFGTLLWLLLGMLVLLATVILLSILFYQAYTVVILENLGAVAAVRRSVAIGKQNISAIFSIFALSALIVIGYIIVIGILAVAIEGSFALSHHLLYGITISQAINFILDSAMASWFALIPVGFYMTYVKKAGNAKAKR